MVESDLLMPISRLNKNIFSMYTIIKLMAWVVLAVN